MNCHSVTGLFSLYLYGELPAQKEEEMEQHLFQCSSCKDSLNREKNIHRRLSEFQIAAPAPLLAQCRAELMRKLPAREITVPRVIPFVFRNLWPGAWRLGAWRPAGALALLAMGFFSARLTYPPKGSTASPVLFSGEPIVSTIRSVQPNAAGGVQIAIDETRRRLVTGNMKDANIERLMLAAVKDEANAGLRVESMDILKGYAGSADVRDALILALQRDPNPGVRLKALEALKGMQAQPEVRRTLTQVLQNDDNPGVRIQAIDLLMLERDTGLVGILQNLVTRESNNYVRLRCQKALEEMNASVGTF